jgi:hypothetical protein
VHPQFESDEKDGTFLQWIMEAFDRKDYDYESHKTEGYEYIKFKIAMDSSQKFFDNYYIQDFEQTMKRKVERNDFKYAQLNSDEYSYDKSWIHS